MPPVTLLWSIFVAVVVAVSALDLFVITHRHTPAGITTALRWTALWVALAAGFGIAIYCFHPDGGTLSTLFIAGYLTEYSLSVDNLFVFILVFQLMAVPAAAQPKLIKVGIFLSIALRVLFIFFGIALIREFRWLLPVFGIVLVWTAWKMLTASKDEQVNPQNNILYRLASEFLPVHTISPDDRRLVVWIGGRLCITPLFLVFLVIGSTDVLFAVDSIPAIMGISQDPFVVVTSNVFAVLGLNSLFFALRGIMGMFKFLQHGVSFILFFIGAKMVAGTWAPAREWFERNTFFSLAVIVLVLSLSIALSLWHSRLGTPRPQEDTP